jgi:hypothetical protein
MDRTMDLTLQNLALAAGLAWASGIRLYAVLFLLGSLHLLGIMVLPEHLEGLAHPWVMAVTGGMAIAEFLADKVPGFDSLWDAVHTFIRIPAGALLAAAAMGVPGADNPALLLAAAIAGGVITAGSHLAKAGTRVAVNHSPEPFSNWTLSFVEDFLAPGIVWTAIFAPVVLLVAFVLFVVLVAWLLPRLARGAASVLRRAGAIFR